MLFEPVGRNANDLDVALFKVLLTTSYLTELGSANGGEISRVRKEDSL